MRVLILICLIGACSDYPSSEGNNSEETPINIHITIDNDNNLADPTDNNSQNVDVKSDSTSNSSSDNNSTESNSKSSLDNSTWLNVYEFNSI
ncbi:MAG: hypothetical protein CMP39_04390 [Rickettsiales bacterium]|nr:hypothetical protein [Rickettsiales bacterium]|tara:strand:+ start:2251 stop:2526 length:276 start_codon:yes stop_codon:yes gene_type:complete